MPHGRAIVYVRQTVNRGHGLGVRDIRAAELTDTSSTRVTESIEWETAMDVDEN